MITEDKFQFDPLLSDFLIVDEPATPISKTLLSTTTTTSSTNTTSHPLASTPLFPPDDDLFSKIDKESSSSSSLTDFLKLETVEKEGSFLSFIEEQTRKEKGEQKSLKKSDDLTEALESPFAEPPRPTCKQMIEEFPFLFPLREGETEIDLDNLRTRAQHGDISGTVLRGVCWKLFLGLLVNRNPSLWHAELQVTRKDYDRLVQQYIFDPHKGEDEKLDLAINNPLSQDTESPWQQYFQDVELKKQIRLDLIRLFPERAFFKNESLREAMLRILFIYAKENPTLLYKQGMHELLAPVVYTLYREKVTPEDIPKEDETNPKRKKAIDVLLLVSDERYVEHDAYGIFCKMMNIAGKWFVAPPKPARPVKSEEPFNETENDNLATSPIVQKCKRIQQELLRRADPELYTYLQGVDMEPQLYALYELRWVRLLLGREFHLEDVLTLWDAVFAYGHELVLVDYLIVSMLVYIRQQLIGKDQQECLHRLFNYPPVEDVKCLIEQALRLINPSVTHTAISKDKAVPVTFTSSLPSTTTTTTTTMTTTTSSTHTNIHTSLGSSPPTSSQNEVSSLSSPKNTKSKSKSNNSQTGKKKPFLFSINSIINSPSSHSESKSLSSGGLQHHSSQQQQIQSQAVEKKIATLQQRVTALEQRQTHMATRLERIIYTLQSNLGSDEDSEQTKGEKRDAVLLALAEIKQVKDTLAGFLPEADSDSPPVVETHKEVPINDPLGALK